MRRAFLLLLGLAAVGSTGCAARPRGAALARRDDPRDHARDGWARLGPGVHLREDSPSLSTVLAPPQEPVAPPSNDFGPQGDAGESSPTWSEHAGTPWPVAPWGAVTPWGPGPWGPYVVPGGAVPPALRAPTDRISPLAGPYLNAFPASDVASHRPGLSSGAAIYGR